MEDFLEVSGCSARSIFRAFQESRTYSPMAFVRQVRLTHARKNLLGGETITIAEIAHSCGFGDLAKFSKSYRESFGELPSQTRKKRPL
jgi:transcriptional regulator GlxA family with amidase domain